MGLQTSGGPGWGRAWCPHCASRTTPGKPLSTAKPSTSPSRAGQFGGQRANRQPRSRELGVCTGCWVCPCVLLVVSLCVNQSQTWWSLVVTAWTLCSNGSRQSAAALHAARHPHASPYLTSEAHCVFASRACDGSGCMHGAEHVTPRTAIAVADNEAHPSIALTQHGNLCVLVTGCTRCSGQRLSGHRWLRAPVARALH